MKVTLEFDGNEEQEEYQNALTCLLLGTRNCLEMIFSIKIPSIYTHDSPVIFDFLLKNEKM